MSPKSKFPVSGESQKRGLGLKLGPGLIVAAAFVGPGTVTTAAKAGATHGLGLVWVVLFAVLATVVLQEMTSRLGTLTGMGLGELLRRQFTRRPTIILLAILVTLAIGFGNAAYQAGNLIGAAGGLESLLPLPAAWLVVAIATVAAVLLWLGSYRTLERVLISAVSVMGLAFVAAAVVAVWQRGVVWSEFAPQLPGDDLPTVLALIGTTIVPYNLFLHASAASQRWSKVRPRGEGLRLARLDSTVGVALGGLVTLAILVAAAAALPGQSLGSAGDAAVALESVLGGWGAKVAFSIGLAAAGLTSAITAPLAAAYAVSGVCGWSANPKAWSFRAVWGGVLLAGLLAALIFGASPTQTIVIAQAANALVLPVIAIILLMACNAKLLGKYANTKLHNLAAAAVILIVVLLSISKYLV